LPLPAVSPAGQGVEEYSTHRYRNLQNLAKILLVKFRLITRQALYKVKILMHFKAFKVIFYSCTLRGSSSG